MKCTRSVTVTRSWSSRLQDFIYRYRICRTDIFFQLWRKKNPRASAWRMGLVVSLLVDVSWSCDVTAVERVITLFTDCRVSVLTAKLSLQPAYSATTAKCGWTNSVWVSSRLDEMWVSEFMAGRIVCGRMDGCRPLMLFHYITPYTIILLFLKRRQTTSTFESPSFTERGKDFLSPLRVDPQMESLERLHTLCKFIFQWIDRQQYNARRR